MVLTPTDIVTTDNCATTGTVSGECTVVVNSDASGTWTASAEATLVVDPGPNQTSITLETGDQDNIDLFPGSQRGDDADKTYVNLRIEITPLTDTNAVNDAHTFTVTVEKTDVMNQANTTGYRWSGCPSTSLNPMSRRTRIRPRISLTVWQRMSPMPTANV